MTIPSTSRFVCFLLSGAALLALGACKSEEVSTSPTPSTSSNTAKPASTSKPASQHDRAEISNDYTANAAVVGVRAADRVVTLRREDGTSFDVQCGPAVRNFDQIAVGDTLRVQFKESLAVTKLPPGEGAKPAEAAVASARTPAGSKPGAGMGMAVSMRVKIESIDREHGIVVFSLNSGELIAHRLATSEGREFASTLHVGDMVQIDHVEVLALAVDKM